MNNTKSIFIGGILAVGVILANFDSNNASPASESKPKAKKCPPRTRCLDFEDVQRLRQEWLAAHPEESSSSDTSLETQTTPPSEIYVPSLSCVLFKELGCDVQCTIAGSLLGIRNDTSATCDKSLACICTTKTASLDDLWGPKFLSNGVLEKIKRNKKLAQKVTKVMRNTAFQSASQTKQELESVVRRNIFKRIQFIEDSSSSETDQKTTDSIALESLKDYVGTLVGPALRKSTFYDTAALQYLNWVKNYVNFLDKNKHNPIIQKVYHQTRLTENNYLQEKLDDFLKNNDALKENKTQEYPQDTTIQQIATDAVINRMMIEIGIPKSKSLSD